MIEKNELTYEDLNPYQEVVVENLDAVERTNYIEPEHYE